MRRIIALGVASLSVATMTFGAVGPAGAVEASLTDQVCAALPAQVTGLSGQLAAIVAAIPSKLADLGTKSDALDVAVSDLADAVVVHIETVTAGGDVAASGQAMGAAVTNFAGKLTAANNALTVYFEALRGEWLTEVAEGYVVDVQTQLCAAS